MIDIVIRVISRVLLKLILQKKYKYIYNINLYEKPLIDSSKYNNQVFISFQS